MKKETEVKTKKIKVGPLKNKSFRLVKKGTKWVPRDSGYPLDGPRSFKEIEVEDA